MNFSFLSSKLNDKLNELRSKAEQLGLQSLATDLATDLTSKARGYLEKYLEEKDEGQVGTMLDRVANEILTEDRREALGNLRDLLATGSPVGLATFGEKGLPVMTAVVRDDRADVALVQLALETIRCGLSATVTPTPELVALGISLPDVSAINVETFARGEGFLELILTLLEEEPVGINDPVARYEALRILRRIASVSPARIEEVVLSSPSCLSRLLDIIGSGRELVRSEALGLLAALSKSSEHVQNIVAYENAFDRLLAVYDQEGGARSAMNDNAADALDVLSLLLRSNPKSQAMFRELNFFPRIVAALQDSVHGLPSSSTSLSAELQALSLGAQGGVLIPSVRLRALNALLGVFHALVPRMGAEMLGKARGFLDASRADNLRACGGSLLGLVLALIFHPKVMATRSAPDQPAPEVTGATLRASGLSLIASICQGQPEFRDQLVASRIAYPLDAAPFAAAGIMNRPVGPEPQQAGALHAIVRRCIFGESREESFMALEAIQKFCAGNPEGQLLLASTLSAPVEDNDLDAQFYAYRSTSEPPMAVSFGSEIIRALLAVSIAPDGVPSALAAKEASMASCVLATLVTGSTMAKDRLVHLPLQLPSALGGRIHDPTVIGLALTSLGRSLASMATDYCWYTCCSASLLFINSFANGSESAIASILQRQESIALIAEAARISPVGSPANGGIIDLPAAGLASSLLGLLASTCAHVSGGSWTPNTFLHYAANYVTISKLFTSLDLLRASPIWLQISTPPAVVRPKILLEPTLGTDLWIGLNDFCAGESALRALVAVMYSTPDAGDRREALAAEISRATDYNHATALLKGFALQIEELEARNRVLMLSIQRGGSVGAVDDSLFDRLSDAELRASRAEGELVRVVEELDALKRNLAMAISAQKEAELCTSDLRTVLEHRQNELSSLSSSYAELEAHANLLEKQLAASGSRTLGGDSQDDIERRVQHAHEAGRAEAEKENEEAMNDLFVVLGGEEAKVAILRARLEALGVDVDDILVNVQ